jgi:hypothetical protein
MRTLSFIFCFLLLPLPSLAETATPTPTPTPAKESWLCVEELDTGFTYDKRKEKWRVAAFGQTGKYLVRPAKKPTTAFFPLGYTPGVYEITEVGSDLVQAYCGRDFDESGDLMCIGIFTDFRMNRNNKRFIYISSSGYVITTNKDTDEGTDTPLMSIGKCSPL